MLPFHEILPATQKGDVDAGLIIHESRFTYPTYGLHKVIDLGEWWELETGHPIPLGGILARRDIGKGRIQEIDRALKSSVEFAHANPETVRSYIRKHAQEMDEEVMRQHIELYVNDYTLEYGQDGEAAIHDLIIRAEAAEIIPPTGESLFIDG